MKKPLITLLLLINISLAFAQKNEEQVIKDTYSRLMQAMIDGDREKLLAMTSPALSYGHSGGKIENQQEFVEVIASGQNDFSNIEVTDLTVQIHGKNAIVRNHQIVDVVNSGKAQKIDFYVLSVFEKKGKRWLLYARQGFRLPVAQP